MSDNPDWQKVWLAATKAAENAAEDAARRTTPSSPSGFAWVIVHPARGSFVTWCRRKNEEATREMTRLKGRPWPVAHYGKRAPTKGWVIWAPASQKYRGDKIDVFVSAANAFAEFLREFELEVEVGSRVETW